MKTILALVLSFIAATSFALDIPTSDGKLLRDCEIKAVEKDGVRVSHKDGTGFLDFDTLPIALQKQYGWTAEKSAARKAERVAEAERQRIASENGQRAMEERAAAIAKAEAEEAKRERLREANKAAIKEQKEIAVKSEHAEKEKKQQEDEQAERRKGEIFHLLYIGALILVCFIPTLLARGKSNFMAVLFVNLLAIAANLAFGDIFAGVCWLLALVMAFRREVFGEAKQEVHIHNVYQQPAAPPQQPRPVARPVAQVQPVAVPRVVAKPLPPSVNPPPPTA